MKQLLITIVATLMIVSSAAAGMYDLPSYKYDDTSTRSYELDSDPFGFRERDRSMREFEAKQKQDTLDMKLRHLEAARIEQEYKMDAMESRMRNERMMKSSQDLFDSMPTGPSKYENGRYVPQILK